ncbi:MAG TPA: PQQ-binding-like beta-propeller repeat protein [Anaerolineales bacterium]|nr:PQQ-binding-like beta-propeller repeat protein [Anaerolineales bacterium]
MTTNQPTSLTCPTCGAPLETDGTSTVVRCKFCGSTSMLPGTTTGPAAGAGTAMEEIRRLVASGNLSEASARFQQAFGVNSQVAGHAIGALQAGRVAASSTSSYSSEQLTRALQEVQQRLKAGDKIGAIKIYREHYDVGLERAKYAVEQIDMGQTSQPEAGFHAPSQATQATQPARPRSRAGWIMLTIVLLIVAGVVALIVYGAKGGFTHDDPELPLTLVPSSGGAAPQVAAVLFNADADSRSVGLVDLGTGKMVWEAAKVAGSKPANALIAGTDMIYAANSSDLLAYHKSDGSLAWQASMPDRINYDAGSIQVAAGRVITNNADQSIQAYDAETGKQVWSRRMNGNDRTLRLMGNSLVVLDTDSNNDYGLIFLDPATGTQQSAISPTCNSNGYTSNIDLETTLLYDQAGNSLYLIYDSSYGCVQRLDLSSGKIAWEADSKNSFSADSTGFQPLMTDSTLYFRNQNDLMAVDKSSGNMKVLISNPDFDFIPLAVAGDKLILRARKTRGSETYQVWGVDIASGSPAWQINMQNSSPIDPPDALDSMIDDSETGWTWHLASTGLVIGTFQAKPNQLVLETFNPATGASLGKQAAALKGMLSDFYDVPKIISWQGNTAYFYTEVSIYSLDLSTGKVKIAY